MPCIVWNAMVHYHVHNCQQLVPVLSQMNSVHIFHPVSLQSILISTPSKPRSSTFQNTLLFFSGHNIEQRWVFSISPTSPVWNTFHSLMYCVCCTHTELAICTETHLHIYIKFLLLLSNFNKNCNVLSNCFKIHTQQIACTYIHTSSFYKHKGRPTDRVTLVSAFFLNFSWEKHQQREMWHITV